MTNVSTVGTLEVRLCMYLVPVVYQKQRDHNNGGKKYMLTAKTTVSKTGNSLCLILPKVWTRHHELEHHQDLLLSFMSDGKLLVEVKEKNGNKNKKWKIWNN